MRVFVATVLACACAIECGGQGPPSEAIGGSSSRIQGGISDTTHTFAVGIVEQSGARGALALCSGALLAPNLVATARHCVSSVSSTAIDCRTSSFGGVSAPANVLVTTDATLSRNGTLYAVSKIVVPSGANQTLVCGNDLALLILSRSITLPQYVAPVISPPMTDHAAYSTTVTAIGYGVDTPTDTRGASSGVRRIRENINLACIPNDKTFPDCLSDPTAAQFISPNEFISGDGICEGDSGSSAFEQRSFNAGTWVSFGVLSRGGVNADGSTCVTSIYTRFDAWGQLVVDTAKLAAQMGGYAPPAWAGGSSDGGQADASAGEGGGSCLASAAPCNGNGDCCSNNCLSHDNVTFVCAACDPNNPCDTGYSCQSGTCVVTPTASADAAAPTRASNGASAGGAASGKGCNVGQARSAPAPFTAFWWAAALCATAMVARRARRARSGPIPDGRRPAGVIK